MPVLVNSNCFGLANQYLVTPFYYEVQIVAQKGNFVQISRDSFDWWTLQISNLTEPLVAITELFILLPLLGDRERIIEHLSLFPGIHVQNGTKVFLVGNKK